MGCLACGAVDSQAGWSLSEAEERVPQGYTLLLGGQTPCLVRGGDCI